MNNPFAAFVEQAGVAILDGALATELERRGADLRDPLWSAKLLLDNPGLIRQVHYDYFVAGADVATTASYQATFPGLAACGLSEAEAAEVMLRSVRLAQQARAEFWSEPAHRRGRQRPLVAASLGCYGAYLHDGSEYRGDYGLSLAELMDFHRPRLEVLARSGADVLACETIPCQLEAEALVRLLADHPRVPAWLSFSCRDDEHVCHGERLSACAAVADQAENVVAVGINCTPPRFVSGLLRRLSSRQTPRADRRTCRLRPTMLLAYPNSGETWHAEARCWREAPAEVANWRLLAREWVDASARLIGGCCRTTPELISQIAATLRPLDLP